MNAWLTVLKQAFLKSRAAPFAMAVWLPGATAMTAALWPECPYPFASMEGMGWRLAGLCWTTFGIAAWASFRHGLDTQVSPAAVQLVPGLRPAAISVTIVSWLVMATALALETCVYGVPFPWIFAALLMFMAITVSRRPGLQQIGLLLPALLWPPIYGYRFPLPGGPDAEPWVAWMAALVAMAMGAAFIVSELGKNAEAHASLHRRVVRPVSRERQASARGGWDAFLQRPKIFQWAFDRILRSRSREARVLHGLGPAFHWSQAAVGGAWQALPTCLFMYAVSRLLFERDDRVPDPVLIAGSLGAFFFAIALADYRMRELYARRKEQAILLILPGAPQGRDVNRWLIQTLVLHHVIAIVTALWLMLAVALALQQPLESALKATAPPLIASLLTTVVFVRDYARMRQPRRLQYTLLSVALSIPLYWALIFRHGDPVIVIVTAGLLSGAATAWRWVRLATAPTAFPVGRLAA